MLCRQLRKVVEAKGPALTQKSTAGVVAMAFRPFPPPTMITQQRRLPTPDLHMMPTYWLAKRPRTAHLHHPTGLEAFSKGISVLSQQASGLQDGPIDTPNATAGPPLSYRSVDYSRSGCPAKAASAAKDTHIEKAATLTLPQRQPQQGWSFLSGWLQRYDHTLPESLLRQCQALQCSLCKVQMNSEVQAKMHYEGKLHDKHTKTFLANIGNANPRGVGEAKLSVRQHPSNLACEICCLNFTSELHAQQHYRGRNHGRRLAGLNPLKSGYFNRRTGRWQRDPVESKTQKSGAGQERVLISLTGPQTGAASSAEVEIRFKRYYCALCNVSATSQEQLEMHLVGKNHKTKEGTLHREVTRNVVSSTDKSSASLTVRAKLSGDFSAFRTPSGHYYCPTCKLTVNSEQQLKQHVGSKRHKRAQK